VEAIRSQGEGNVGEFVTLLRIYYVGGSARNWLTIMNRFVMKIHTEPEIPGINGKSYPMEFKVKVNEDLNYSS
jgi:hypothetical protein